MAFLNETGLATFLSYLKAWARAAFASKTDTQTIEGSTTFSQPIVGNVAGNAATATKLATARTISLTGDVSGSASFDGSADASITATVADDSHNHVISNVDGLQTALDAKAVDSAVVHKTGDEIISGTKTFSTKIIGTSFEYKSTNIDRSDTSTDSEVENWPYIYKDKNGDYLGRYGVYRHPKNGINRHRFRLNNTNNAWADLIFEFKDDGQYFLRMTGSSGAVSGGFSGNAATATKLAAAKAINGTNFDGSAAIITANWGTARNIYVSDSDETNTGSAVSVNGSANATLKLPATIKASITGNVSGSSGSCTGNAATATKLATARKINGVSFDGSTDITVADSTKVAKSGDTMTGALNGRAGNVNLSAAPSSAKEDWRFLITKNSADTVHTGNLMRLGVAQSANTKDYRIMLAVANPRAGNLPTQDSIAGGTDDSDASTANCWGGIGLFYDYSKNAAYPTLQGTASYPAADNSIAHIPSTNWVRTATGNFACNAATASALKLPTGISYPERTVLCADGVWRDISQIAFPTQ